VRTPCLVWFRLDLRLADNPALEAAVKLRWPVVPVFIYAPDEEAPFLGTGSRVALVAASIAHCTAGALELTGFAPDHPSGPSLEILRALVRETRATAAFWNRRYETAVSARDQRVEAVLRRDGVCVESYNAALLHEPWTIRNQNGKPFQVRTSALGFRSDFGDSAFGFKLSIGLA
jgi:deoxyribodipyrimidine photo-lyase